jgi:hypothetical protein
MFLISSFTSLVVLIIPFVQAYSHDSRSNRVRVHACGSVYHQALANSAAERGRPHCSACGIDFENNTIVHHFFIHSFPHGFDNYLPGARIVCKRVIGSINKLDMFLPFLAFSPSDLSVRHASWWGFELLGCRLYHPKGRSRTPAARDIRFGDRPLPFVVLHDFVFILPFYCIR